MVGKANGLMVNQLMTGGFKYMAMPIESHSERGSIDSIRQLINNNKTNVYSSVGPYLVNLQIICISSMILNNATDNPGLVSCLGQSSTE